MKRTTKKQQPADIAPTPEKATLRDQFAMAAISGTDMENWGARELAENAYELADAMLKARAKRK